MDAQKADAADLNKKIGYIELITDHYESEISETNLTVSDLYNKMLELCGVSSSYVKFDGYLYGLYYIDITYMGVYYIRIVDATSLAKCEEYISGNTKINEMITKRMNSVALQNDVYYKDEVDSMIASLGGGTGSGDSGIVLDPNWGLLNMNTGNAFGFNDEGCPTINNVDGRRFGISTTKLDDDYIYYTFPERDGTVALLDDCLSTSGGTVNGPIGATGDLYVADESGDIYTGLFPNQLYHCPDGGNEYYYDLPGKSGTVALLDDIPTYYMHTITISKLGAGTCNVSFMVLSKSATEFTAATLYAKYLSKAFAASGYYGSNIVSKLAMTSTSTCRFVYGSSASTSVVTITELTDTVIPIT